MKSPYETFPLGLRLSHAALLRNLDRFVAFVEDGRGTHNDLADFVALYVEFLNLHHLGEDEFIFPALRRHSAGRSTDAAMLEMWTSEHREVYSAARSLDAAARQLRSGGPDTLAGLRLCSLDLKELLVPHLSSEEAVLTSEHLAEMIPERALAHEQRAIGRKTGMRGLQFAAFLMHSLAPAEQRALLGDQPWLLRKVFLGIIGERRMARFRPFVFERTLAL